MRTQNVLMLLFFFSFLGMQAQQVVRGVVLDESKDPLAGVNVIEKGTSNGTSTDFFGNYSITVDENATLVFSYLGFKTQEVAVNGQEVVDVLLLEDASQLDEVVVQGFGGVMGQARRRAESVQNIPESVVTFPAEQIEATGVNNLQSFAGQIPNFQFNTSQNVGVNFVTVRGIPQIRNGEAPVAFVVDGVTVPDANLLNQEQFDLAMVEIVKGPQGALYGKNAIAGAINVLTQKPSNLFKGKVNVGYGSGNTLKGQMALSGALVKDKLFFRASGSYKKSDGLFTNIAVNDHPDYYDDTNFRGQLTWQASPKFRLTASGQYSNIDGGALYYHTDKDGAQIVPTGNLDNVEPRSNELGVASLKNFFGYLKADIDFENMKMQVVTSYNDAKRNHEGDLDHGPAPVLRQYQDSDSKVFNAEVRLGSKTKADDRLSWDLGGFYQKNEKLLLTRAWADFGFFGPDPGPSGTFSLLGVSDFTNTYNTIALFGFIDYKVTPKLTVSAGLRYDNDAIEQVKRDVDGNVIETPDKSDSELQPKFSLAYKATDNMMMFANYGRGYRVGGFNAKLTPLFDDEYSAETSDNYEVGLKTNWWNDRLIVNTAVYYTKLNNQQQYGLSLVPPDIFLGNYNYNESDIRGFEADMKLRTSKYLDILASYGVSKAEIIDGGVAGMLDTNADGTLDTPNDRSHLKGVKTPFVPQDSYSLGLQSNFPISDNIDFRAFVNLKGTGKIYWHEEIFTNPATTTGPLPQLSSPGYKVLDARIGADIGKNIGITLWGANILDERYAMEFYSSQSAGGPGQDLIWLGNPATFGVDVMYKF
ncbi:MAG: TonB-dependent receptor [Flavobacteriaceae bacterium]